MVLPSFNRGNLSRHFLTIPLILSIAGRQYSSCYKHCEAWSIRSRAVEYARPHRSSTSRTNRGHNTATSRSITNNLESTASTHDTPIAMAEHAFAVLARRNKSWNRLQGVVDLALQEPVPQSDDAPSFTDLRSATDIGTDHGLLAMALAISGRFDSVVGVDISERALTNGAIKLKQDVLDYRKRRQNETTTTSTHQELPLSFRVGNGLAVLQPGEANVVCIAGVGAHTILEILTGQQQEQQQQQQQNRHHELLLNELGCQRLCVQPTNSKPRNLMFMYQRLYEFGWQVEDERIEYVSSRWYLSTSFIRASEKDQVEQKLPGEVLVSGSSSSSSISSTMRTYIEHHCAWIQKDQEISREMNKDDATWLDRFGPFLLQNTTL